MRIAFISDIHGNAVALEAVLKDISKKNVDKIVVLGDISFRGPEPKRSLGIIKSLDTDVIKGNAEEWIIRGIYENEVPSDAFEIMKKENDWARKELTDDDINYFKSLPTKKTINLTEKISIHIFHATPNNLFEAIFPDADENMISEKIFSSNNSDIYLYGHIHIPYVRFVNGKCLANLGSVGLPLDGLNMASYLIIDGKDEEYNVSIQRVRYDVEKVFKQLQEKNYPNLDFMKRALFQK